MAVPVQVRERVDFHRDIYRSLIKGLMNQRNIGEFCDVVLKVNGRKFFAHKAVLAAASRYFSSMFTSPMKEKNSFEVDLTQSLLIENNESFRQVLDFMYSGDIEINVDNAEDMLRIADFLLLEDIKDYCRQFYLQHGNLSLSNCICIEALATHHNLAEVAHVARNIIRSRFHDYLLMSEEIMEIPGSCFMNLLHDRSVTQFSSSNLIIRGLLRWAHHGMEPSRRDHLLSLLSTVDMQFVSKECLKAMLSDPFIKTDKTLMEKLLLLDNPEELQNPCEAVSDQLFYDSPPSPGCNVEIQDSTKPALVAVNCNPGFRYMRVLVYNVEEQMWCSVPINMELVMRAIPARLGVSSITLHANVLYMFLSYNLPYPSDMLKVSPWISTVNSLI